MVRKEDQIQPGDGTPNMGRKKGRQVRKTVLKPYIPKIVVTGINLVASAPKPNVINTIPFINSDL
jgi:hypothetical protein